MKRIFLSLVLMAMAGSAHANLGDTYAESCRRYGGKGVPSENEMRWLIENGNLLVQAAFHNDQCVAIQYTPLNGRYIYESAIWNLLAINSLSSDHWERYDQDERGNTELMNGRGNLFAKFFSADRGELRICYRSWLQRHGLFRDNGNANSSTPRNDYGRSPVDDEGNAI